jgi:hypothetical protein
MDYVKWLVNTLSGIPGTFLWIQGSFLLLCYILSCYKMFNCLQDIKNLQINDYRGHRLWGYDPKQKYEGTCWEKA